MLDTIQVLVLYKYCFEEFKCGFCVEKFMRVLGFRFRRANGIRLNHCFMYTSRCLHCNGEEKTMTVAFEAEKEQEVQGEHYNNLIYVVSQ